MTRGRLATALLRFVREEDGPSATEYAILLAMLVLVAVVAIRGVGERMYNIYESINAVMPNQAALSGRAVAVDNFLFWVLAFTGSIVCGWQMAVRPRSACHDVATPVSFLLIVLAVLLALLGLTGQDFRQFSAEMCQFALGR